jgi:hypothetical protein
MMEFLKNLAKFSKNCQFIPVIIIRFEEVEAMWPPSLPPFLFGPPGLLNT